MFLEIYRIVGSGVTSIEAIEEATVIFVSIPVIIFLGDFEGLDIWGHGISLKENGKNIVEGQILIFLFKVTISD